MNAITYPPRTEKRHNVCRVVPWAEKKPGCSIGPQSDGVVYVRVVSAWHQLLTARCSSPSQCASSTYGVSTEAASTRARMIEMLS